MSTATKTRYALDDEVTVQTGPFAGQAAIIDEVDLDDEFKPYRVRFEDIDGEPIGWYAEADLKPTGGAR